MPEQGGRCAPPASAGTTRTAAVQRQRPSAGASQMQRSPSGARWSRSCGGLPRTARPAVLPGWRDCSAPASRAVGRDNRSAPAGSRRCLPTARPSGHAWVAAGRWHWRAACPGQARSHLRASRRLAGVQVKQLGGEVDGISIGPASEAIIVGFVQHHTGVVVGVERTAHHAMAVWLHTIHFSHLPNGDGGLDSLIQAQGHSSFVSCVARCTRDPKVGTLVFFASCLNIRRILQKGRKSSKTATEKEKKPLPVTGLQQQERR